MEQIQELITRVINGDTQAFEEIYQATYRQVYYTAFSFLKNEQNTLDVMQDTYITAHCFIILINHKLSRSCTGIPINIPYAVIRLVIPYSNLSSNRYFLLSSSPKILLLTCKRLLTFSGLGYTVII